MLGLYPTWFEPGVGSGWIIGFIATIHVLFSHASVGGAVLFAWLANFAVRRDKPAYLAFIRRYGLFLLIFSYVLGSITGPGIWFAATIASPRGISALIHSFVWLWASEWVFFVIEVIASTCSSIWRAVWIRAPTPASRSSSGWRPSRRSS